MEDSLSNCMEPFALSLWTEAAPARLGANDRRPDEAGLTLRAANGLRYTNAARPPADKLDPSAYTVTS